MTTEPLTFVDTNVLVHAHNRSETAKHEWALAHLQAFWHDHAAMTSTQVLAELYSVMTRTLAVAPADARALVLLYSTWPVIQVDSPLIVAATIRHEQDQVGFWDALVVEAALRSGAKRPASEDLQQGRRFDSLEVVNPLGHG